MTTLNKLIYSYQTKRLITPTNTVKLKDSTKLDEFVKAIVTKKKAEVHHQSDPFNEASRWRTGMGGEMALEQFLGVSFVDTSVGNSDEYHVPDLSKLGLNVGIKTVEYGKYPVIFKHSERPEIIILRLDDETFSILGLATKEVLNNHQDDNQILSPSLMARGTKTGFIGFYKLKSFNNLQELTDLTNSTVIIK